MTQLKQISRLPLLPPRSDDGHKGTFGTVIVIGGCDTMIGAPALTAAASLRAGAGLTKIAAPLHLLHHILTIEPSATGIAFEGSLEDKLAAIDTADPEAKAILAIGPGIGQSSGTTAFITHILAGKRAVILDADGLNALASTGKPRQGNAPLILTPHPGEFNRLAQPLNITASPTDPNQRLDAASQLAIAHNATVILKGHRTIIADNDAYYINKTGGPALATAGSGDVLTGITASLLAQHTSSLEAAILATHLHGTTADLWTDRNGVAGLKAHDLTELLPFVMQTIRRRK
ncbi:NAD(P)H-hydrate dehydratase [Poriferisphaera sp. WC338]|uniref:NAD(P)H-hydrate dehydratase n=1 Tax=Poriferisphaera sp. WC338 TaxID=3425129 RepID=UPI003D8135B8